MNEGRHNWPGDSLWTSAMLDWRTDQRSFHNDRLAHQTLHISQSVVENTKPSTHNVTVYIFTCQPHICMLPSDTSLEFWKKNGKLQVHIILHTMVKSQRCDIQLWNFKLWIEHQTHWHDFWCITYCVLTERLSVQVTVQFNINKRTHAHWLPH